jgi:hypothetical protein
MVRAGAVPLGTRLEFANALRPSCKGAHSFNNAFIGINLMN